MALPQPTSVLHSDTLPAIPQNWSALTWQQLCRVWEAKLRYGGNPDVARVAALLALLVQGERFFDERSGKAGYKVQGYGTDPVTGEDVYLLTGADGKAWTTTARQLSHTARQTMKWFEYPYGDRGDEAVKDEKGKVVKEAREPVHGYVNPDWRDAMRLPEERIAVCNGKSMAGSEWDAMSEELRQQILHSSLFTLHFSLPALACSNLTWEQYRSIQPLVPLLWREETSDEERQQLQAEFVAHCLVPETVQSARFKVQSAAAQPTLNLEPANLEPTRDRFQPPHDFKYDAARAEQSIPFWREQLAQQPWIYHICFQVYQTSVQYYETVYPLLFSGGGKDDPLRDALTGEVGTINAVMKYARYRSQQEVYDSFMPYILDILNTMTKEAKEIEKMNARIKKK